MLKWLGNEFLESLSRGFLRHSSLQMSSKAGLTSAWDKSDRLRLLVWVFCGVLGMPGV
jgi:hypothetical protein